MNSEIEKINDRIVSTITAILDFKAKIADETDTQDFLQTRFYSDQKTLRLNLLIEDLAELQHFYEDNFESLRTKDWLLDFSGIIKKISNL